MDGVTRAIVIVTLAYLALMGWFLYLTATTPQPPC